jgi:hypothetical protein
MNHDSMNEPAFSPDFATRVIDRVRVERMRRIHRRRAALAAVAVTGMLAFIVLRGTQFPGQADRNAATASWSESNVEQAGWPLGWDTSTAPTMSGYFFPDAAPIENFSARYQNDTPSLGAALGFDQGAIQRTDLTESGGY